MFGHHYIFKDRIDAGKKLGEYLLQQHISDPFILALPRGGVSVAKVVASMLRAPLDVVIARKVGSPDFPEYGIGAISEDYVPFFNPEIMNVFDLKSLAVLDVVQSEKIELARRVRQYRQGRSLASVEGKTIIVVDDGLATGVTAAAAGRYLWTLHPKKMILAIPVGPDHIPTMVRESFDEIIILQKPRDFRAVAQFYERFPQVEDEEVMKALRSQGPERGREIWT